MFPLPRPARLRRALRLLPLLTALGGLVTASAAPTRLESARLDPPDVVPPLDGRVALFVDTRDAAPVALRVEELGGTVDHVFENIDGLSVRLPLEAVGVLAADPRVTSVERQRLVRQAVAEPSLLDTMRERGVVPDRSRVRRGATATSSLNAADLRFRPLDLAELRGLRDAAPASFLGYDLLTGAADTWEAADYGEGTLVVVIDTGIFPGHPLIEGNVVGGMNLVPAEEEHRIDVDGDGVGDGLDFDWDAVENDDHGTFVSGLIAGHADLEMPADEKFAQSVLENSPESVTIEGDVARIRLMGTAPGASLFAIKVFPFRGGSAPDARIAQAVDLLISAKRRGQLDVDVVNMSLSGPILHDDFYFMDRIVNAASRAGIACVCAAANDGPSHVTVGSPGSAHGSLTAGGAIDPIHLRVAIEMMFDLPVGMGRMAYPHELEIVDFSARGLTADGRVKPEIVATGLFVFSGTLADVTGDGLPDVPSFGFASGTSFSTPTVAGAVALLSAYAKSHGRFDRPEFLANALVHGAAPVAPFDRVSMREQGAGFLRLPEALEVLSRGGAGVPPALDPSDPTTATLSMAGGAASGDTPLLAAGETFDFYVEIPHDVGAVHIAFPGVTHVGPDNPVLGDAMQVLVHSAKRGGTGDYVFGTGMLEPGDSFVWPLPEAGRARVTFSGSPLNYGEVAASVDLMAMPLDLVPTRVIPGRLRHDEHVAHVVQVPDGLDAMGVRFVWEHDWTAWPTYDLDMFLMGPDGVVPAATLNSPELAWVEMPTAGEWTFHLLDYSTVRGSEPYRLEILFVPAGGAIALRSPDAARARITAAVPTDDARGAEVRFALPSRGPVALEVFDVAGRRVRSLASGPFEAGEHAIGWDGRDADGHATAAGVYFVRLVTDHGKSARKVVIRR